MKKVLLIAAFAVFGLGISNAQEEGIKLGVSGLLPMGDAGDLSSFGVALDVSYLWEVGDGFLAGATTGFQHNFGKEIDGPFGGSFDFPDQQFIPIAASARYYFSDGFFGGADLGYALGVGDGFDGGFYYRPKVGYSLESVGFHLSYGGVSVDGGSWSFVGLGVEFGL